jgi:hypothetical protein
MGKRGKKEGEDTKALLRPQKQTSCHKHANFLSPPNRVTAAPEKRPVKETLRVERKQ